MKTLNVAAIAAAQDAVSTGGGDLGASGRLFDRFKIQRKQRPPNYPIRNQLLQRIGDNSFRVGVASCQGKRSDMEDAHVAVPALPHNPHCGLFGVFDGHNGTDASRWLASHLPNYLDKLTTFDEDSIKGCMLALDADFLAQPSPIDTNHGSTSVFALVEQKGGTFQAKVANLGDSRAILGHYSKPDAIPLTVDHKPTDPEEVKRVEAAGGYIALKRVDGVLAVSRAIGDSTYKTNSAIPLEEQKVTPVPVVTEYDLTEDNFLFICCDGIFEVFSNDRVIKFIHDRLRRTDDLAKILHDLLVKVMDEGGQDNMTAMIIQFKDGTDYAQKDEIVIGEWYEKGHDGYTAAYKNNCDHLGLDLEETKQSWCALEAKMPSEAERLKSLVEEFGTCEVGSEVLRMALCDVEYVSSKSGSSSKRKFGKSKAESGLG